MKRPPAPPPESENKQANIKQKEQNQSASSDLGAVDCAPINGVEIQIFCVSYSKISPHKWLFLLPRGRRIGIIPSHEKQDRTCCLAWPLPHEPDEGDEVDPAGAAARSAAVLRFLLPSIVRRPTGPLAIGVEFVQCVEDVIARSLMGWTCVRERTPGGVGGRKGGYYSGDVLQ